MGFRRRHWHLSRTFVTRRQLQCSCFNSVIQLSGCSMQFTYCTLPGPFPPPSSPVRSHEPVLLAPVSALDGMLHRSIRIRTLPPVFLLRELCVSYSSTTNMQAPSASTNPSRSTENGREPFSGCSFLVGENLHQHKTFHDPERNGCIRAARKNPVCASTLDLARSISHGIVRRRRPIHHHMTRTA